MKQVYLIGMMGAGKTVVGEALARELNVKFVDLDDSIVKQLKTSVNEIFETRGETYFRKVEKENLYQASKSGPGVVATGGGVILDPENISVMKNTGWVVYLRAPIETLWERVQHKQDRPLLKASNPREVFFRLFLQRTDLYEAAFDHVVNTENQNPKISAKEIVQRLGLSSHERN